MTSNFMDCEVHAKKYLFRCFEWDRFPPTETLCKNIGRLLVVIKLVDFLGCSYEFFSPQDFFFYFTSFWFSVQLKFGIGAVTFSAETEIAFFANFDWKI